MAVVHEHKDNAQESHRYTLLYMECMHTDLQNHCATNETSSRQMINVGLAQACLYYVIDCVTTENPQHSNG